MKRRMGEVEDIREAWRIRAMKEQIAFDLAAFGRTGDSITIHDRLALPAKKVRFVVSAEVELKFPKGEK